MGKKQEKRFEKICKIVGPRIEIGFGTHILGVKEPCEIEEDSRLLLIQRLNMGHLGN